MVEQVHQQARRMGALRAIALCRCFSGALHFQNGNWKQAETDLDEAVDLYRKLHGASGEALSLQRQGVLLTARGLLDQAMSVFDAGVFAAERATMRSHCLTRLYASMARNRLAAKDLRGAEEYMEHGELAAHRHGHCVTCNALLLPEAVRVKISRGDLAAARSSAEELDRIASEFGSAAWRAMARQAGGRVLAAGQSWSAAAEGFAEAASAFGEIQAPYEVARCRRAEAEALLQSDRTADQQRGRSLATEAEAAFAALGAAGVES